MAMTPSRIEYTFGARRAVVTHYGRPRVWVVECQTWTVWRTGSLYVYEQEWRTASNRTSEHTTRRAAEQAAQAWCREEQ